MQPLVRQPVFDAYWRFAAERQRIFHRRARGEPGPWTDDPILRRFKFCNAYRASDRVSQYLITRVIYDPKMSGLPAEDVFLRVVLFRLFSKEATWEALEQATGGVRRESLDVDRLGDLLQERRSTSSIYTAAFILCAHDAYGLKVKHRNHLRLVSEMFAPGRLGSELGRARSLRDVYAALLAWPMMGPFMSYQLAIDLNYTEHLLFDEDDFTVPGPGAVRGLRKVFSDPGELSSAELIMRMVDQQEEEFGRLGLDWENLFGRRLHAIDCQGLFCEVDKYSRRAFPDLKSNRARIKQTFTASSRSLELAYPPKWNVDVPRKLFAGGAAEAGGQLVLEGSAYEGRARAAPNRPRVWWRLPDASTESASLSDVLRLLDALHRPKDAAYGDAWRRRGEVLGIFSNIARKADRLERAMSEAMPSHVERIADTVADLAVYGGKYLTWLAEASPAEFDEASPGPSATACDARRGPDALAEVLHAIHNVAHIGSPATSLPSAYAPVRDAFTSLERGLMAQADHRDQGQLAPDEKIALTWRMTAAACILLVVISRENPGALEELVAEVRAMGA